MPQDRIRRYLRHGTLPQLRVFEASVRLGSLARASEELHMAPPTASVQVKKLAETVGSPLFEQIGRQLYPTEVGWQVYSSCLDVFRALSTLEEGLVRVREFESGRLRLAVTSAARSFAPRLLGAFTELHPRIETVLHIDNCAGLTGRLQRNEEDLYVFAHPPRKRELVTQSLIPNPLAVLARRDHPLASRRAIAFERMAAEPFIAREPGSGTRSAVMEIFAAHRLSPRVHMELDDNESIREAIVAGCGISILPRYVFGSDGEDKRLVALDVEGFPVENRWQLVYPQGKELSAVARAFLDFARSEAKSLACDSLAA